MPSTIMSWVMTIRIPPISSTAASSSRLRAAGAVASARSEAIKSDSEVTRAPIEQRLLFPNVLRHRVEQAVDEPRLARIVEGLRHVDIFGNDAAGGYVGTGDQLVGAGAQDLAHRLVEPAERPAAGE